MSISAFANSQIDIESSKIRVQSWEDFTITITLRDINLQQENPEVSLPGIENFDVFSQSVSNSFQNINGVSESVSQLILQLTARNTGEFEIGPVEILWEAELRDNERINISVLSSGITPPAFQNSQIETQEQASEELENTLADWVNEDLSWLREVIFPLWAHGAFLLFFILSFYFLLRYIFSWENTQKQQVEFTAQAENTSVNYKDYFYALSQKIWGLSSGDFFHEYNNWIRKIFSDISHSDMQSATLMELQKHTIINSDQRFSLFKKSYKHEYSGLAVSEQTQKKYIDDILKLL